MIAHTLLEWKRLGAQYNFEKNRVGLREQNLTALLQVGVKWLDLFNSTTLDFPSI
jgi:hypothetical protein